MFKAGDQVPVIPFIDVVGNTFRDCPLQFGATGLKLGVIFGLTTIVIVALEAHCAALGVNVYVVVAVLFIAGDHVPTFPFKDVVGNGANA